MILAREPNHRPHKALDVAETTAEHPVSRPPPQKSTSSRRLLAPSHAFKRKSQRRRPRYFQGQAWGGYGERGFRRRTSAGRDGNICFGKTLRRVWGSGGTEACFDRVGSWSIYGASMGVIGGAENSP